MEIILTCGVCRTQREPQPFESHVNVGGQTTAHCNQCKKVTSHEIGVPALRLVVDLEFERRKPQ